MTVPLPTARAKTNAARRLNMAPPPITPPCRRRQPPGWLHRRRYARGAAGSMGAPREFSGGHPTPQRGERAVSPSTGAGPGSRAGLYGWDRPQVLVAIRSRKLLRIGQQRPHVLTGDLDGEAVDAEELLGDAVVLAVVEFIGLAVGPERPEGRAPAGADPLAEGVVNLGASAEADDHRVRLPTWHPADLWP